MNIHNAARRGLTSGRFFCGLFLLVLSACINAEQQTLTLDTAINSALQNDPWLQGNRHQQNSIESMSIAASTLPDPKVSVGLANIAADSFDFDQEAMTQFKIGISQMLPRGDSLAIKSQQLKLIASEYPFQRQDRKAKVTVLASKLWFDIYKAQQSIVLIEKDRALFEQLADIAQASYSSNIGKTRQQDIVRAQLELTRLDDRLAMLKQQEEMRMQQLSEWLSDYFLDHYSNHSNPLLNKDMSPTEQLKVSSVMPEVKMILPNLYLSNTRLSQQTIFEYLSKHPSILALEQRIKASKSGISLAKQMYKPEWGLNAGYGYRDSDATGRDRSDLFSIGVSFDLPLFTGNRQDKQVQSAVSKSEATKTQKWLLVRKLIASFETSRAQLVRLTERQSLYNNKLLPQMHDQAEASLTAYTNDDGDFAEVIRSRIAELNASIDSLGIDVERQKNIVQLNYFFMNNINEITASGPQSMATPGELK